MSAPDVPVQHIRRPHQLSESSAIEQHMVNFSFNPCRENDLLIVQFSFAKNGRAMRSKKREAKLRVKNLHLR